MLITPFAHNVVAAYSRAVRASAREERGLPLPHADTQRCKPQVAVATAQLVQERDDEPRAAHPERMAERDRATVHVHAFLVEPELAADRERLRGEGLVQLDEVDIVE